MEPAREASIQAADGLVAAFERAGAGLGRARDALSGVIFGQAAAIDLGLAVIVAGGGAVLCGGPGSAKTALALSLGRALGLDTGRIRFTPDLALGDLNARPDTARTDASGALRPRAAVNPLLRNLLLAQDLEQASPRVRTALLEAVHEGQVVIDGVAHRLPQPFHLLVATTTDTPGLGLDEAEQDRFMAQIDMGAPDRGGERRLLIEAAGREPASIAPAMDVTALREAQRVAVELPVGETVVEAILDLVRRARPDDPSAPALVRERVTRGPGPRAGQALMRLARARALIDGRATPSAADVRALALPVLKPRLKMMVSHGRPFDAETVVAELTSRI